MFAGMDTDPLNLEQSKQDDLTIITPEGMTALLMVCFKVAMSNYSEPQSFKHDQSSINETNVTAYCPYVSS